MVLIIAPLSSLKKLEEDLKKRRKQVRRDLTKVSIALAILELEDN